MVKKLELGLGLLCRGFKNVQENWSVLFPALVHNSILVTHYLTKMGIKTVPHRPYSPDLAHCDFCLFPKLRGCRYERIEEMKETVTKVIDSLTQEDFQLLEWYKCIVAGGDFFEGD